MTRSTLARSFLAMNAGFSITTGLALLFASRRIAALMFTEPGGWMPTILIGLGIGLLIFALDLILLASNRYVSKPAVLLIVVADLGWVLGSGLLVTIWAGLFTGTGIWLVMAVAAIVALFAIGQTIGAARIIPPLSRASVTVKNGVLTGAVIRAVDAPVETVWQVMTDHPGYADVASNLSKVEVVSGDGLGMARRCYGPKGESWDETCDFYEDGRTFGFRIHTEAADYPYPFAELSGRWSVQPSGAGAEFSIQITAKPKGGFVMRKMVSLMAGRQFKPVLIELADGWAARMQREAGSE